jgi:hypothetical protein
MKLMTAAPWLRLSCLLFALAFLTPGSWEGAAPAEPALPGSAGVSPSPKSEGDDDVLVDSDPEGLKAEQQCEQEVETNRPVHTAVLPKGLTGEALRPVAEQLRVTSVVAQEGAGREAGSFRYALATLSLVSPDTPHEQVREEAR